MDLTSEVPGLVPVVVGAETKGVAGVNHADGIFGDPLRPVYASVG